MSLSTKNIKNTVAASSLPKTLKPGNVKARVYDIELLSGFNPGSYHLILRLESEPIGEGFEGFLINKDDESLGKFAGQVGRVRYSYYAFEDKKFPGGGEVKRDDGILMALNTLAKALGVEEQLSEVEASTVEEFVSEAKKVLCSTNTYIPFCLAGKEYEKNSYVNYDLFLPKTKNKKYPFASSEDNVQVFEEKEHIMALVKKSFEETSDFQAPTEDFNF